MKWTEEEMSSKMNMIHNMDCLEFMKKVPDNYFDLVLTDPPYGIGITNTLHKAGDSSKNHGFISHDDKGWDNETPSQDVFDEIFRISKNQIIWGGNYFAKKMSHDSMGWLYWNKGQEGFSFADGELAWTSFDNAMRAFRLTRVEFIKEKGHHPTQKPFKLIDWCFKQANTNTNHKVFDPFMGSGTTAIVAKQNGISFCGTELEPDYCEIANKRLSKVQTSMFAFMEDDND